MSHNVPIIIKLPEMVKGKKYRTSLKQLHLQGTHLNKGRVFCFGDDMATQRSDRTPGNRGAYEKARAQILKTQTHCGICGKPVDPSYKYPHPLSPTVDHIIPVSLGGHPSDLDNLQLAHRCCNREKSNKLVVSVDAEEDSTIDNRDLPLSMDWTAYKA